MNPTEFILERGVHHGASVIFIRFEYNGDVINYLKSLGGMRWSSTHKAWHTPYSDERMNDLISRLGEVGMVQILPDVAFIDLFLRFAPWRVDCLEPGVSSL